MCAKQLLASLSTKEPPGERFTSASEPESRNTRRTTDTAYDVWEREASWKKRRLARAILTDLETYGMFERAVMDTGNPRLRGLIASLSHFVPQMALPKVFDTAAAEELLDFVPPRTASYWEPMLVSLIASGWSVTGETEEVAA